MTQREVVKTVQLSIIIPCFNEEETIGDQLESLASQSWNKPWEIIVSDNGSTDATLSTLERYRVKLPNLRLVDSSDRKGAAHARNIGALAANSEALAFCDADDVVGLNWVSAIGKALQNHDFVASRFDIEKLNDSWIRATHQMPQENEIRHYANPPYLKHAGGSGLGVKRTLHEAVGGFEESLDVLEDTDYCWRIQRMGTDLHFVSDAVVHVRYCIKLGDIIQQSFSWGMGNVFLYKKYRLLGMPDYDWHSGLLVWKAILKQFLRIRNKANLCAWIWQFAWKTGRLAGCYKYRVFAP